MYVNVMKKGREGKENRRNGSNFFKYVQPQSLGLSQQSKLHSRSLLDLDQNSARYQQSARGPTTKEIHHSSLGVPSEHVDPETIKSHSLKKFLTIFGGPAHLNQSSTQGHQKTDENHVPKATGRQAFTCSVKTNNLHSTNPRDKDQKHLANIWLSKRQKSQGSTRPPLNHQVPPPQAILNLKKALQDAQQRERALQEQLQTFKKENSALKMEAEVAAELKEAGQEKFRQKEAGYLSRIEQLQKEVDNKQKCREHELIIESLKKVINEQLKKIIELQKLKVERQEIDKLEEKISKNMSFASEASAKERLRMLETNSLITLRRKTARSISIQDDDASNTEGSSPVGAPEIYEDTIEEAAESEEKDSFSRVESQGEDSILEEVDRYLARWRGRS